jgi:hypothetical protein
MIEDVMGLERFALFQDNAQLFEQIDRQRLAQQGQENLMVESQTPGISG